MTADEPTPTPEPMTPAARVKALAASIREHAGPEVPEEELEAAATGLIAQMAHQAHMQKASQKQTPAGNVARLPVGTKMNILGAIVKITKVSRHGFTAECLPGNAFNPEPLARR